MFGSNIVVAAALLTQAVSVAASDKPNMHLLARDHQGTDLPFVVRWADGTVEQRGLHELGLGHVVRSLEVNGTFPGETDDLELEKRVDFQDRGHSVDTHEVDGKKISWSESCKTCGGFATKIENTDAFKTNACGFFVPALGAGATGLGIYHLGNQADGTETAVITTVSTMAGAGVGLVTKMICEQIIEDVYIGCLCPSGDSPGGFAQLRIDSYVSQAKFGQMVGTKDFVSCNGQYCKTTQIDDIAFCGVIAEKPSESLFTLDATGSEQIRKSHKTSKPLKADEILSARSAIAPVSNHNRLGVTDGIIVPSSKRRKGNGVSPQEYERLRRVAYGGASVSKDVVQTNDTPDHDPWATAIPNDTVIADPLFSYLEPPKAVKAPSTLKHEPISLLANSSAPPAVPRPKPAISYNPVFSDWNALLTSAGAREVALERERLATLALEEEEQARIATALAERDEGYKTEEESAWEGIESEFEGADWLKKKRPERKTQSERNKVKRRKEAERQAKWALEMKKREKQATQIQRIAKDVIRKANNKATQVAAAARKEHNGGGGATSSSDSESGDAIDPILRRRKFGKHSLPTPSLELVLPSELRDSLRLLKPEGNLLRERFQNVLLRGKMETRNRVSQRKKRRTTSTEKWMSKDFRVPGEV
ncbi:MAG: hypothetical protein Q9220_002773 [cf. Caloplaca sp. 1 TL-2023]